MTKTTKGIGETLKEGVESLAAELGAADPAKVRRQKDAEHEFTDEELERGAGEIVDGTMIAPKRPDKPH